jgi:diguanylate cyclase (GGDEF)-like protein
VIALLFTVTGAVNTRLDIIDFVSFSMSILLYWGFGKYVQISLEKEALLRRQNEMLEQRVAEQVSELSFLANQDTLTTLFNRRYFISRLEDTIRTIDQDDLMAVLLIDLDRFKTINDAHGHDVGDNVLAELSSRMLAWNHYGATIARLGGDEFAVMLAGKYMQKDIEDCCIQIVDICRKPIAIDKNTSLTLTMSVGIALASYGGCDVKTLMKRADIAMYSAKSQGYNRYQFYNPIIDLDFKQNLEIEALLKQTDIEKNFILYYQPQYSLRDLKLIGAEALIRWENQELGYIPPDVFIPIAEEADHIFQIGKWVMQETIHQSKLWNSSYPLQLKVGFNFSPKQFNDIGFIRLLETFISAENLDPRCVDVEITERAMIKDEYQVREIFKKLKKMGVSVSVDDFGSGYSALSYLNKYPFDRIKIDKALVDSISPYSATGNNIVKAAINMAHAAGIQALAEGVEDREQLEILKELGCDQVQGYLLGRPVPADVFAKRYIEKCL